MDVFLDNRRQEKIFMIACSIVFITSGMVMTIVFIQEERFDPEFRLESATVSQLNITGPELTATWDLTFVVVNPNHKFSLSFRTLQSTIYFKAANRTTFMLATKPVPPPQSLGPKSEAVGSFRVVTVSAYVGDDVAKEIEEGVAGGDVAFQLNFLGWLRNSSYSEARISVYCNRVEFRFLPGNWTGTLTMKNESRACASPGRVSKFCSSGMDY